MPFVPKILGTTIFQDLTWESNIEKTIKKSTDGLMTDTFFYHFAVWLSQTPHQPGLEAKLQCNIAVKTPITLIP